MEIIDDFTQHLQSLANFCIFAAAVLFFFFFLSLLIPTLKSLGISLDMLKIAQKLQMAALQ